MSLAEQVGALATRIGQEIKSVRADMALGGGGSGVQRVFAQAEQPTVAPGVPYIWFQTGLGDGNDMTMWIEDGQ